MLLDYFHVDHHHDHAFVDHPLEVSLPFLHCSRSLARKDFLFSSFSGGDDSGGDNGGLEISPENGTSKQIKPDSTTTPEESGDKDTKPEDVGDTGDMPADGEMPEDGDMGGGDMGPEVEDGKPPELMRVVYHPSDTGVKAENMEECTLGATESGEEWDLKAWKKAEEGKNAEWLADLVDKASQCQSKIGEKVLKTLSQEGKWDEKPPTSGMEVSDGTIRLEPGSFEAMELKSMMSSCGTYYHNIKFNFYEDAGEGKPPTPLEGNKINLSAKDSERLMWASASCMKTIGAVMRKLVCSLTGGNFEEDEKSDKVCEHSSSSLIDPG